MLHQTQHTAIHVLGPQEVLIEENVSQMEGTVNKLLRDQSFQSGSPPGEFPVLVLFTISP